MTAQTCPVCAGRQTVAAGFYRDVPKRSGPQTCRACHGAGVLRTFDLGPFLVPRVPEYIPLPVPRVPEYIPLPVQPWAPWPGYPQPYVGDPLPWDRPQFWWGVVPPSAGDTCPATTITVWPGDVGASDTIRASS